MGNGGNWKYLLILVGRLCGCWCGIEKKSVGISMLGIVIKEFCIVKIFWLLFIWVMVKWGILGIWVGVGLYCW